MGFFGGRPCFPFACLLGAREKPVAPHLVTGRVLGSLSFCLNPTYPPLFSLSHISPLYLDDQTNCQRHFGRSNLCRCPVDTVPVCVCVCVCVCGSIVLYICPKSILAGVWWLLYFRTRRSAFTIIPPFFKFIAICYSTQFNTRTRHPSAAVLISP